MSVTVTISSNTLTPGEAGAVVAFLMAVQPDAVQAALERLDDGQPSLPFPSRVDLEAMERGTPEQTPAQPWPEGEKVVEPLPPREITATPVNITPAEAFGAPAPVPTEAERFAAAHEKLQAEDVARTQAALPEPGALDKLGLPWDDRIHATSREGTGIMTDKGVWRKKRGLNQLIEHKVVAELRETYPMPDTETPAARTLREAVEGGLVAPPEAGSTAPAVAPPEAGSTAPAVAPPPPPAAEGPTSPPAPVAATPPAPPAPVPPVPAPPVSSPDPSGDVTFAQAMQMATAAQAAGKITTADTLAIVTEKLGLGAMRELAATANAHLVPRFVDHLRELGA